ncbi:MAG: S-methyl-5-thioadenosine phosphorylase [Pseudomonadota bacterium]
MAQQTFLGVIGGSGLYDLPGITNVQEKSIATPFGMPSDAIITGTLNGRQVAFLPRHGKGHRFTPSEVNYRANIFALKSLGVTHILSVSAVGSLQEKYAPGCVVIPKQLLDKTAYVRERTFFGKGVVGHISLADPYCPQLQEIALSACKREGVTVFQEGTYVCVEGPRFSSRAESHSFRNEGCGIIGMTAMPEASLAREAEIPYCTLAFVTDYDCWKEHEEAVSVEAVLAVLKKNVDASKRIVKNILEAMPESSDNPIFNAAQFALMTSPEVIPAETKRALWPLFGKYWSSGAGQHH